MPWEIYEAAVKDSHRQGYKRLGRYLIGLSLKSMLDEKRQEAIAAVANSNPREQDSLFRGLQLFLADSKNVVAAIKTAGRERKKTHYE